MQPFQKEILTLIRCGIARPGEKAFNRLALQTFEYQRKFNPVYRRFCDAVLAGRSVRRWQDIPALPVSAFKVQWVACFGPKEAKRVFKTSGTTLGNKRGRHAFADLRFYDEAIRSLFGRCVLAGRPSIRTAFLIHPPTEAPESSLSYMAGRVVRLFGKGKPFWTISKKKMRFAELLKFMDGCAKSKDAVLLTATTLALDAFLTFCEERKTTLRLPPGSRVMETGGAKGTGRQISRPGLLKRLRAVLGISSNRVINEYGMTELSSQFYDTSPGGIKGIPPWCRILIVDPACGRPLYIGRRGLIRVLDLANQGSCAMIQTEDEGRLRGRGFELLGRRRGADLRGCSLSFEEIGG